MANHNVEIHGPSGNGLKHLKEGTLEHVRRNFDDTRRNVYEELRKNTALEDGPQYVVRKKVLNQDRCLELYSYETSLSKLAK